MTQLATTYLPITFFVIAGMMALIMIGRCLRDLAPLLMGDDGTVRKPRNVSVSRRRTGECRAEFRRPTLRITEPSRPALA